MDEDGDLGFERRYHASGEGITWAIEQIDPDYIVPIHTEAMTRQPTDDLGLYLSSIAGACYHGRDFCCTEQPSEVGRSLSTWAKKSFVGSSTNWSPEATSPLTTLGEHFSGGEA
jgi:hypothetical protein